MILIEIKSRQMNDFFGMFECQNCKAIYKERGCSDAFYLNEVIPRMKCKECGLTQMDIVNKVKSGE